MRYFFIFLLLTMLMGAVIFSPYANFQDFLAQGDHGRDLYAAQSVLRGELPYRDFWWVYGPLMPYYYAAFFKIFGVQITSVLLGKVVLNILCGIFCFLAASVIFSPAAAFVVSLWLMCFQQDFFFTYNHAGGIALILGCVWMNVANSAFGALAFVFLLGLVKINFGAVALIMTILAVHAWGRADRKFYLAALSLPLAWLAVYSWLTRGLTFAEIRQCFPYLPGDEPNNHFTFITTLPLLLRQWQHMIRMDGVAFPVILIIFICLLRLGKSLLRKGNALPEKKNNLSLISYAALFCILNLNEYLPSGLFYRSFWAEPLAILLCAMIIVFGLKRSPRYIKAALWLFFVGICLVQIKHNTERINSFKVPEHYLDLPKAHVYIKNDPRWIQTVRQTTFSLEHTLKEDDLFFALPYDCLYYYLTNKRSPTRQLIIFQHIKIPPEQERRIIAGLMDKKVSMILLSSRQSTLEGGRGTFGKTYCPELYKFIREKYEPVAQFGEWEKPSGWIKNHGTRLLRIRGAMGD